MRRPVRRLRKHERYWCETCRACIEHWNTHPHRPLVVVVKSRVWTPPDEPIGAHVRLPVTGHG